MDVFLIRHGEMEFEKDSERDIALVNAYATGTKEGPLTPKGVEQARLVAGWFEERKVDALYSSAFIRTRQTAEETSRAKKMPVTVIKDFGELNVGRLDPDNNRIQSVVLKSVWELYQVLPRLLGEKLTGRLLGYFFIVYFFRSWHTGKTLEGESVDGALKRIEQVFKELEARHGSPDSVVVFTHGYFIHLLVNHILDPWGTPLRLMKNPYIQNGSITHLNRSGTGSWQVRSYAVSP